eukprot:7597110-Lingulodinium_polyedra.AAC.1
MTGASTEVNYLVPHADAGTTVAESVVAASWSTDTLVVQYRHWPWAASPCGGDKRGRRQSAGAGRARI